MVSNILDTLPKKRHKRPSGKKSRVSKIPNRIDITERPPHVDLRKQAGHWEVDTVVSRQSKACVAVLVERKPRFFIVIRMKDKTASSMNEAVTRALKGLPAGLRKSLTYDNGLENTLHERTNRELGVKSYFCKPYHSWEKRSIENRNGILRRYFPKKHDWRLTTQKKIDKVVSKINAMPMKCLGFKTPLRFLPNAAVLHLPVESGTAILNPYRVFLIPLNLTWVLTNSL